MVRSFLHYLIQQPRNAALNRELDQWLQRVVTPTLEADGRTLVFNTVRSNPGSFHLYTDFFIGHMLARCGCQVHLLLDDGVLRHWDTVQRHRVRAPQLNPMHNSWLRRAMQSNVNQLQRTFAHKGLHVHWYSNFLANSPQETIDADMKRYALASTLRHFEMGFYLPEDPRQRAYNQLSVENARISKQIGRKVLEQLRPSVYATSHGIYSTWGPAYSFLRRNGIKTLVYSHHPYNMGGFMLDDAPGGSLNQKALDHYLDTADFNTKQRSIAETYLESRYTHKASDTAEYFGTSLSAAVGLPEGDHNYRYSLGMFPNVAWDAIGDHLQPIYDSVVEWMADTIKTIAEQGKHRLVVRFHPSESTRLKGTLSTELLLRERLPELESYHNIVLIPASSKINSYELMRLQLDLVLVYTGTLGGEAQPLGKPVVSAASGRFSQRFVTICATQEDYRSILNDPQAVISDFEAQRETIITAVMKYHYYISEELFFPIPVLSKKSRHVADVEELRELGPVDQVAMERTLLRFLG